MSETESRTGALRLRPLGPGDGPALAAIHRAAILASERAGYGRAALESWAAGVDPEAYARIDGTAEFFEIAERAGRVLGFCSRAPRAGGIGEICGLCIATECQGQGVGSALLASAEAALAAAGATRLVVAASLADAPFYTARGYAETTQERHRTPGGLEIAVLRMEKTLARPGSEGGRPWRNFYGRRHGKKLRPGQERLLEERLAELAPAGIGWQENPGRLPIDLEALFPGSAEVWLEIGFGGGEHMIAAAAANPSAGIIGCEAFVNGVAMLLSGIERAGLGNLAIHPGDARDLIEVLPPASIGRVYLLYPDPWPKTRHHKRRFVSPGNLDALARIMRPGAELRIATDIADYVRHSLERIERHPAFRWTATRPSDWREPWQGWPGTRYEAKALRDGRRPHYLRILRS